MSLLDSVNNMKANIDQANAIFAQLQPMKEAFDVEAKKLEGLDHAKTYFGVNADGTATVIYFNPDGSPKFQVAEPLPEPVEAASEVALPMGGEPVPDNVQPLVGTIEG